MCVHVCGGVSTWQARGCVSISLSPGISTTKSAENQRAASQDGDPCVSSEGERET